MTRSMATLTSLILLVSSTGCMTHRTCSAQDMVTMKQGGFSDDQIETSCTTRRFDGETFRDLSSTAIDGARILSDIDRTRRKAAAASADKTSAQVEAATELLSSIASSGENDLMR